MEIGKDANGEPLTLENAIVVPLPDYLDTPELQEFLAQFDQIEARMAAQVQKSGLSESSKSTTRKEPNLKLSEEVMLTEAK